MSSVLARLLSALDEGELEDGDLVALALAVDQSAFKAEVTDATMRHKSRALKLPEETQQRDRPSVDTDQPRQREPSLQADSKQVSWAICDDAV